MFDKMKQLMEVKRQAEVIKKDLEATVIDITEVDGITIRISGTQKIQSVILEEDLMSKISKGQLQERLCRSFNAAIGQAQNLATRKMKEVTGLNIPGL